MQIRECEEQDYPALKPLFQQVYPHNPLLQNKAYFDWQFKQHPWNDKERYTLWLLCDAAEIVGFYGWVPVNIVSPEGLLKGCEPLLWWANPQVKLGGIQLLNQMMHTAPLRLYHNCAEASESIFKSWGMPLFSLPRWVAILKPEVAQSLFQMAETSALFEYSERFWSMLDESDMHRIQQVDRFSQEMHFQHYPSIQHHLQYTPEYLNWRYFQIPDHQYAAITSGDAGEYGVYRIEEIKNTEYQLLRIMEWSFSPSNGKAALAFLMREFQDAPLVLIDFYGSASVMNEQFQQLGFYSQSTSPIEQVPHLFRPICESSDYLCCIDMPPYRTPEAVHFEEWYLSKGNSDMDRQKQ